MLAILLPDLSTLSFCNSWPNFHYALLAHTASRCRRAYIFYRCGFLFLSFLLSFFFFPSFSTPNLWGHWTDLNQTWTRIHLWFLFEQFGPNSPCIYPHGLGTKKTFLDRLWNLTEHISATEHDINNRKKTGQSIYRGSPTCNQIWWTLVQKRLRTVGEFLPTP